MRNVFIFVIIYLVFLLIILQSVAFPSKFLWPVNSSFARIKISSDTVIQKSGFSEVKADSTIMKESSSMPVEIIDTIIKQNGDKLMVIIKDKNLYEVKYYSTGNKVLQVISSSNIKEIHYADGHIETIDSIPEKKSKDFTAKNHTNDWEQIIVTYKPKEVALLIEKSPVEVEFIPDKFNADNEFLERSAIVVMKKKAFFMKASAVLIVEKSFNREYGEFPSIVLKGIAYSKP
jgi:hypothetical protein